jgi:hypothetical protein
VLTNGGGGPIELVVEGANRHDFKSAKATIARIPIERPEPTLEKPQGMGPDRDLGAQTTCAKALTKGLGVIACSRRQPLEPFARSAALTRVDVQGIQQRDDVRPLIPMRWSRAHGQGPARGVREAVEEEALACPALGDALAAPLARGKRRHRPHHSAIA